LVPSALSARVPSVSSIQAAISSATFSQPTSPNTCPNSPTSIPFMPGPKLSVHLLKLALLVHSSVLPHRTSPFLSTPSTSSVIALPTPFPSNNALLVTDPIGGAIKTHLHRRTLTSPTVRSARTCEETKPP